MASDRLNDSPSRKIDDRLMECAGGRRAVVQFSHRVWCAQAL
jgi:hypothetical protein